MKSPVLPIRWPPRGKKYLPRKMLRIMDDVLEEARKAIKEERPYPRKLATLLARYRERLKTWIRIDEEILEHLIRVKTPWVMIEGRIRDKTYAILAYKGALKWSRGKLKEFEEVIAKEPEVVVEPPVEPPVIPWKVIIPLGLGLILLRR